MRLAVKKKDSTQVLPNTFLFIFLVSFFFLHLRTADTKVITTFPMTRLKKIKSSISKSLFSS